MTHTAVRKQEQFVKAANGISQVDLSN